MAADATRLSILSAAERLYADRGFSEVTLRDIVAAAGVNLAAVNYHFGSKDELIAELYVSRSVALNRERLTELKTAEDAGGGRADISGIIGALVGPPLRDCLGPDRQRSAAARFMVRASAESVPVIRGIRTREIGHLRRFAAALRHALPGLPEADIYWALHFALAMTHETINGAERLQRLSGGACNVHDVAGITARITATTVQALALHAPTPAPRAAHRPA
ncbi:MAG: TetR/AcrR family transcriptional regulator [Xanthobacteraceae bacterium]